jgi:hypothetical protein
LLALLLKGVQDDNAICKRREINDAERAGAIANAYFSNTRTHRFHRLPIIRLQATLDPVELVARGPSRAFRKFAQAAKASPRN